MKLNTKSIGFKLWIYFTAFAAVILAVLWLLQTVFLQSLYNSMQKHQISKIADEIYRAENTEEAIDTLAADNSILILLTDANGSIIYSADEYSPSYRPDAHEHGGGQNPYRINEAQNWQEQEYRRLPAILLKDWARRTAYAIRSTAPTAARSFTVGGFRTGIFCI